MEVVEFSFKPFGVAWVVPERVIDLIWDGEIDSGNTYRTYGIWHHCV